MVRGDAEILYCYLQANSRLPTEKGGNSERSGGSRKFLPTRGYGVILALWDFAHPCGG